MNISQEMLLAFKMTWRLRMNDTRRVPVHCCYVYFTLFLYAVGMGVCPELSGIINKGYEALVQPGGV